MPLTNIGVQPEQGIGSPVLDPQGPMHCVAQADFQDVQAWVDSLPKQHVMGIRSSGSGFTRVDGVSSKARLGKSLLKKLAPVLVCQTRPSCISIRDAALCRPLPEDLMVMLVMTLGTYQWPRIAGPFHFRLAARASCRRLENGIVQRELQATHDIRFLPSRSPFPENAKKSNLKCN